MRQRVLVVDDHVDNLELSRIVLESGGFEVWTAENAAQAMVRLAAECPELILMDLQMPGLDGLELTRRLRVDPRFSDIPIVALTAYAMPGDEANALAAGCDGYITKPIDTHSFCQAVRSCLARDGGHAPGRP